MITIKGKHSVLEALLSNVKINDITIFDLNPTGELKRIMELAQQQGVFVRKQQKNKFSKHQTEGHQNVVATISQLNIQTLDILTPEKHPVVVALDHLIVQIAPELILTERCS